MSVSAADPLEHAGPWTEADFFTLPENRNIELLDGSLLVSPWPNGVHRWLSYQLCRVMNDAAPPGFRVIESINLGIAPDRILVPDLTVLTDLTLNRVKFCAADAPLVVEITSPGNAFVDRGMKPQLYAQAGIPHYLRVELDGMRPTAQVFSLDGEAYRETARYAPGETTILDAPFPVTFDLAALIDS